MEVTNASAAPQPHAVMFPFPAQGHVRPLIQLAQCLSRVHGFKVTFVNTSYIHKRLGLGNTTTGEDDLHFVDLKEGFPDEYYSTMMVKTLFIGLYTLGPLLKDFLERLQLKSLPITCVISDFIFLEAHNTTTRLGIPSVGFHTNNASGLNTKYFCPLLIQQGFLPLPQPQESGVRTLEWVPSAEEAAALAQIVTCIPGLNPMRLGDLHTSLLVHDLSDPLFRFFTNEQTKNLREREWNIVNTFHELEASAIDSLEEDAGIKLTTVGPLVIAPSNREGALQIDNDHSISSFWPEEAKCMDWLDKHKPMSVIFVSFGSYTHMQSSALEEIVLGLEESQVSFLLVVRSNMVNNSLTHDPETFPPGFLERIKERALLVSWAPQFKVLSHPATAGFITHCGWNSVIESISVGVPMLGYPYFADQPMNNRLVVSVWKMGLEFERRDDRSLDRHDVAKKVRALATGEAGVRTAGSKWKDAARRAVERDGSSHKNMALFAADMHERALSSS